MGALSDSQMLYRLGKAGFVNGALCYVDDATERRPNGFVAHNGGWVKTIDPGDPNRLVVVPFHQFTKFDGHPSHGLGSYGIDLQAGYNWKYLDKHKLAAMGIPYVRPGMKNLPWVTVEGDPSKPSADQLIIVPPRSAILCETLQRVYIPRDCWGLVAGKSTWARLFIDLNTTPLEPTWCLSEDTEVLTESGWAMLSGVAVGDIIMTRRADGAAEYQAVQAKQAHEFDGDMIHFAGRSVDQLVTPDHELFVRYRTQGGLTESRKVAASAVYGRHNYCFDRLVNWSGPIPDRIDVAGRSWDAGDFLEFYGSWLGDGSAYYASDGGYMIKLAVVTKNEKRERFRGVLDRMGVRYVLRDRGFQFYDKELCRWLMDHGHAHDKFIKRDMLQFGPALLRRLLGGLMQSDGCALTDTYTTVSRRLADDFQELAFKCGQACIVRIEDAFKLGVQCRRYIMRLSAKHMMPKMPPENHALVSYRGMVYDVTVPNHVFLCRRGGKVSWTGNCGVITLEVTNNSDVAVAIEPGEGICQMVLIRGDQPERFPLLTGYADRDSPTYQNQAGVCEAKV